MYLHVEPLPVGCLPGMVRTFGTMQDLVHVRVGFVLSAQTAHLAVCGC